MMFTLAVLTLLLTRGSPQDGPGVQGRLGRLRRALARTIPDNIQKLLPSRGNHTTKRRNKMTHIHRMTVNLLIRFFPEIVETSRQLDLGWAFKMLLARLKPPAGPGTRPRIAPGENLLLAFIAVVLISTLGSAEHDTAAPSKENDDDERASLFHAEPEAPSGSAGEDDDDDAMNRLLASIIAKSERIQNDVMLRSDVISPAEFEEISNLADLQIMREFS